ncbi:hypothetical protein MKEN_01295400 [Mycena kentingensis (nom. inval.)]|nr:hypothetical protein MKEN_01295400 [Mycena kentingensis (nom. inval.)]
MIVHEQPEEEDQVEDTENRPEPEPQTRSRKKAKDTQSRLGVGRPVAVGGAGPRAVTKSLSVSRAKRGKSRTVKPPEDTIPEEAEDEQPPQPEPEAEPEADAQDLPLVAGPSKLPAVDSTSSSAIASAVAIALQPLTQQLQETQAEVMQLRKQVADMSASHTLQTATIAALESDIKALKASLPDTSLVAMNTRLALNPSTSTPRFLSPAPRPSSAAKLKAPLRNDELPNPGIAPTLLGKRSRESTSSNITGIVEADASMTEEELANRIVRPMKKRVKLDNEESDAGETPEDAGASTGRAFAVYSGAEEYVDPPPPTESLPEFYGASSPNASGSGRQPTASQNASENQHPFSYAFLPVAAAPDDAALALPNFPYPEAPTSPSPAGASINPSMLRNQTGRTDMFQAFGLPAPTRPRSRITSGISLARPGATSRLPSGPAQRIASSELLVDPSLNFGDELDPQAALTRTMYGTELDGETRFGDFGLQSVASGFWPGTGNRF